MPYASKAQQGYFHAHKKELEAQGVNVDEWDNASRGRKLPERKTMTMAKGHVPHDIAYAAGGPVLGRSRSFLKEPDQFTGGRKTQPETAAVKQDYGTKDAPKGADKSLSPVKPRG